MKKDEALYRDRLLHALSRLPKKIVNLSDTTHIPEFVLHELCNEGGFDLNKAAFFVDNPDFDFLRGVAGFAREEAFPNHDRMWDDPASFIAHMQQAPFNQRVKNFAHTSLKRRGSFEDALATIAAELNFQKPDYRSWSMKHDNFGFLLYETNIQTMVGLEDQFDSSLYFLNFCPLF